MVILLGCLLVIVSFPFITVPSIIYGFSCYILMLPSFLLLLFKGKPSNIEVSLLAIKLAPVFLIVVLPVIFYFYVWEPLSWIFSVWMIIYFLSRFYTGAHEKCNNITEAWKELESFTKQKVKTYVRNNPVIIVIIIVLTVAAVLVGYFIGGKDGLSIGIIVAILCWWLTPYARETIKETKNDQTTEGGTTLMGTKGRKNVKKPKQDKGKKGEPKKK